MTGTVNTATQRTKALDAAIRSDVTWLSTDDPEQPFQATVSGVTWQVRLNDFPAEPLYTLIIDGQSIGDLEEWPASWQRP